MGGISGVSSSSVFGASSTDNNDDGTVDIANLSDKTDTKAVLTDDKVTLSAQAEQAQLVSDTTASAVSDNIKKTDKQTSEKLMAQIIAKKLFSEDSSLFGNEQDDSSIV
ncbi:MAG: hypothetical protein PHV30_04190 [Candidatus Margulisbacteria bacterium]|nr:hypothetical protein [Candidatus Margulisiibacteriota bacterium]